MLALLGMMLSVCGALTLYATSPNAVMPKIASYRARWFSLGCMASLASAAAWVAALGWGAGLCAVLSSLMLVLAGWPFVAMRLASRSSSGSSPASGEAS